MNSRSLKEENHPHLFQQQSPDDQAQFQQETQQASFQYLHWISIPAPQVFVQSDISTKKQK